MSRFPASTYNQYYTDDSIMRKGRVIHFPESHYCNTRNPMPPKLDPDNEPRRLNIVAPPAWVARVDAWRRSQEDLPNLSEAIRRLVELGLEAERKGRRR